jgi:ORF6N domain.
MNKGYIHLESKLLFLKIPIEILATFKINEYLCVSKEINTMNEIQTIQNKIYEIRGQRVMLDRDLAELYQVTTGNLNKAVKRNIKRFPPDFMFQLTKEEFLKLKNALIFQNGISSWGGTRKLPYAFTEQGLAMLSGILTSDIAIDVNISIMRAFVAIRRMATSLPQANASADIAQLRKDFEELKLDIEDILHDQNDINESTRMQLDNITLALAEMQAGKQVQKPRRKIGFIQDEDK